MYEKKRNRIKSKIKEDLKLNIDEIVIVEVLISMNKSEVYSNEVKDILGLGNRSISPCINKLTNMKLFKKRRCTVDERKIILYDFDYEKMQTIVSYFRQVVKNENGQNLKIF